MTNYDLSDLFGPEWRGWSWYGKDPAKLPQWARDLLWHLGQKLAAAERETEVARLATDPAASDILINRPRGREVGLGSESKVDFLLDGPLGGRRHGGVWVQARIDRETQALVIHASDLIVVYPRSGNAIDISVRQPPRKA